MNYKIIKVDDQYSVLETTTDQIVFSHKDREESKKAMRHMNLGGGFDGFTPSFMIKKIKNKSWFFHYK